MRDHHTGLAVIEARWWKDGNDSVRPLFETLAGIVEGNPHHVRYDMFTEEASLSEIISDISVKSGIHSVYIGAHGDDKCIGGLGDATISRTVLRNMFRSSNSSGEIQGLLFWKLSHWDRKKRQFLVGEGTKNGS
jgi:hypothetical protein